MSLQKVTWYKKDNFGRLRAAEIIFDVKDGRITFIRSDYAFKDAIKAMRGSKYHGYDTENPRRIWSVEDCHRNWMSIRFLAGENIYVNFDKPLEQHGYQRPLMPHQCDLTDSGLTYHYQIWAAEMGVGKGGLLSTKIATPTGWTTLGEIAMGDIIINPEGGTTRVRNVYHRGVMEMFRVTFSDGASTVCSGDHLWNVRSAVQKWRGKPYRTLELRFIGERLFNATGNARYYIPMTEPVEYQSYSLPLDPYLAGYILGNGGFSGWVNILSLPDEETLERLNGLMVTPLNPTLNVYDYQIKDEKVNQWIDMSGLRGKCSHEKHVDQCFLVASIKDRIAFLQGLCDSDGHACKNGGVEYSTTSVFLRDAFIFLVQSLGGTCHCEERYPTYTHKGEKRVGRLAYRIHASFSSSIQPFRLSRKRDCYVTPIKYQPTRALVKIESIGEHECICIQVEAANQLYVTDDFIVTHNTLSAQEVIERSGHLEWWWVGPKTSIPNIQREFRKWAFPFGQINVEFLTYEGLKRRMDEWQPGDPVPLGVIFDESSKLKTWTAQRTQAAAKLADLIRATHGANGFVILMSGTPSPKTPVDWWSQAEITWPGFLAEGSDKAFRARLSFMKLHQFDSGVAVNKVEGWRDDERKCDECGEFAEHTNHQAELCEDLEDYHKFRPSINEVALLPRRLKGLVVIKHKKDCLSLPDKRYRRVYCKPHPSTLRVAQVLANGAPNAITGMTLLRELSDGFQYRDVQVGATHCTYCEEGKIAEWVDPDNEDRTYRSIDILDQETVARLQKREITCPACRGSQEMPRHVRETKEVQCPKDKALKALLEENEEQGRIVVFAGFTGSVDRCVRLCQEEGWDVVRCDGRGYHITTHKGEVVTDIEPLDYWSDVARYPRVAFVAHPESGGMSLTLTEARMAVYWSNSWKPEYRVQSEDRLHRLGTDLNKGVLIVDLIHLPSDDRVLEVIRANRRLELMSMGEVIGDIDWENPKGMDDELFVVDVA